MRTTGFKAARTHARRNNMPKAAPRLGLLALLLVALVAPALFYAAARAQVKPRATTTVKAKPQAPVQTAAPAAPEKLSIGRLKPVSVVQVNFKQLAEAEKRAAAQLQRSRPAVQTRAIHAPLTIPERDGVPAAQFPSAQLPSSGGDSDEITGPGPVAQNDEGGPGVASPSPAQSFLAQEDGPKVGTTSFTIPPDTMGAVGLDKVFTQTNSNFRVHDKATGVPLSTVNSDTFWAAAGGTGVFDPRVVYDPYNNRWITAITSNAQTATSSVEIGISDTSDPQGTYHLYRYIVGCAAGGISPITGAACNAGGEWADFPMLGFSKGWVAITWNQFTISTNAFINGRGIFLDYPELRTGPVSPTSFTISGLDFCAHPATTLDANVVNLYFVIHLSSGGATYRVYTLSGNPPSLGGTVPSVTATGAITRPGGGWTQPGGDILPQQCVGTVGVTCPATLRGINVGDAFVRSNVIYRNGNLYYPQTINLPAGTAASNVASRSALQWTVVNAATGAFVDGGRVEDPTATKTNGGKHYAFGGIAVNKGGDILLGYSQFASNQFASAGYSFRLATDAAGTMRDPLIYKAGEDYYSKAFSGTQNRWGDYSHAAVDPSNDRDLWTIQEYAGTRTVPDANTTTNNSRWGTYWAKVLAPAAAGDLNISEFRLRGPGGASDEYVEVYNTGNSPHTVTVLDGSAGYAIAASDGGIRCTIPNGTVIPARGHYLCVNSTGYSLGSYPADGVTTATGDATFTTDIPDNTGVALFNTANVANFSTATRIDAAGFTSEANTLYREGAGIPAINPTFNINHAFYRDTCGKGGSITVLGACPTGGFPRDTDNNVVDFVFVDTNGTSAGAGQRLGAPGPEGLSSPIQRNSQIGGGNIDPAVGSASPPNRVRDFTSDPPNNSTFGTLLIRKTITNNTGAPITRLRFRVIDQTTFPAPSGFADLRTRTSSPEVVSITGTNPACPANMCTVQGTTMEEPPSQPNGGAFNTTLSVNTVTLATPVAPGASVNVSFLLGIQQTGTFKFFVNIETLP